jgi:hypothetical protein
VAAKAIAERKVWAHRSYLVWMRRQSLRRANRFSIFMALPIQDGIIGMLDFVLGMRRNAGGDAALDKRVAEPDRAVGSICEQAMGGGQRLDHSRSCLMVAGLAFGEICSNGRPLPSQTT